MTIHSDAVTEPTRSFARSKSDSIVGGVCGGIAEYFDWDVNLVRALTVVGAFVSFGTVALVYLAALMLLPQE
ncbi:PspC domain-containing protein [Antrihabitans cavernicola]|uniref:PspC domain-containing protein n=1 Tax=Antrihabitans cavernicola TaxID=2495913 RepID=A0A5A7S8H4_9NOCA|nr:PspC domain-containing protein [Spelaeibacter cavernicola]KAA0022226.1 PspC domain-containing protein [Spelaeibacter cavernicola]